MIRYSTTRNNMTVVCIKKYREKMHHPSGNQSFSAFHESHSAPDYLMSAQTDSARLRYRWFNKFFRPVFHGSQTSGCLSELCCPICYKLART